MDVELFLKIEKHLKQLAPHVAARESSILLKAALDELVVLNSEVSKWKSLADANAALVDSIQKRQDRASRIGGLRTASTDF